MAAVKTKTTADDLAVFAQMKTAINARIKVHGRTTELLRLLFEVDEQRRAVIEGAADDAKSAPRGDLRKIKELAEGRAELLEKAREAGADPPVPGARPGRHREKTTPGHREPAEADQAVRSKRDLTGERPGRPGPDPQGAGRPD